MPFMSNCSWKNIPLTLVNYTIAKSFYYYILADYKQALAYTERSVPHLPAVLGLPEWPEHFIINCLSSLAIQLEGHPLSKAQLKAFKQSFKLLEVWAHESPFNYESKYLLALAESQLLNNNKTEAKQNFNKALVSSQNAGMKYMTALIYERIAAMYEREKETELAERNLNFAVLEYQDWGALAKVHSLQRRYSFLEAKTAAKDAAKNLSARVHLTCKVF